MAGTALYESPLLRQVTGPALRPGGLALTERAVDWCGFSPGDRVLDLGCGLGASAAYMAGDHRLKTLGLDISTEMLAEAALACQGLPLVRADIQAIPLTAVSMDGVVCECVLSLADRPQAVLQECRRVLKPGGSLILSDLYLRNPEQSAPNFAGCGCLGGARGREEMEAIISAAGLELLLWEDHSHYLRELAARLIWEHGSADAVWGAWHGAECCQLQAARIAKSRPGYFLMIAQRKAEAVG